MDGVYCSAAGDDSKCARRYLVDVVAAVVLRMRVVSRMAVVVVTDVATRHCRSDMPRAMARSTDLRWDDLGLYPSCTCDGGNRQSRVSQPARTRMEAVGARVKAASGLMRRAHPLELLVRRRVAIDQRSSVMCQVVSAYAQWCLRTGLRSRRCDQRGRWIPGSRPRWGPALR